MNGMVPWNMQESRMQPMASPGWARAVGGGRREPWVQGSPHGVACVQVGEWERRQPRIQVSGESAVSRGCWGL